MWIYVESNAHTTTHHSLMKGSRHHYCVHRKQACFNFQLVCSISSISSCWVRGLCCLSKWKMLFSWPEILIIGNPKRELNLQMFHLRGAPEEIHEAPELNFFDRDGGDNLKAQPSKLSWTFCLGLAYFVSEMLKPTTPSNSIHRDSESTRYCGIIDGHCWQDHHNSRIKKQMYWRQHESSSADIHFTVWFSILKAFYFLLQLEIRLFEYAVSTCFNIFSNKIYIYTSHLHVHRRYRNYIFFPVKKY